MEITAKEMRTLSPEDMKIIQEEIALYRGAYIGNIMPKVLDDGNSVIVADIISTNASTVVNYPALKGGACKSYAFRD